MQLDKIENSNRTLDPKHTSELAVERRTLAFKALALSKTCSPCLKVRFVSGNQDLIKYYYFFWEELSNIWRGYQKSLQGITCYEIFNQDFGLPYVHFWSYMYNRFYVNFIKPQIILHQILGDFSYKSWQVQLFMPGWLIQAACSPTTGPIRAKSREEPQQGRSQDWVVCTKGRDLVNASLWPVFTGNSLSILPPKKINECL